MALHRRIPHNGFYGLMYVSVEARASGSFDSPVRYSSRLMANPQSIMEADLVMQRQLGLPHAVAPGPPNEMVLISFTPTPSVEVSRITTTSHRFD